MINEIPEAKACSKCNKLKTHNDFYKCKNTEDGLQYWCKDCQKEYDRNKRIQKSKEAYNKEKSSRAAQLKRLSHYHLNYGLDYEFIGKKTFNKQRKKIVYRCLTCGKTVSSDLETAWAYRFNCEECVKKYPGLPTNDIKKHQSFKPEILQLSPAKYNKKCICEDNHCDTCKSSNEQETSIKLKTSKQQPLQEYIKVIIVPVPKYIEQPQPKNKLTIFEKIKKIFHK